uniref:Tuberoinfundibular peptide of 39 residues n=1 Tax=Phascolarctos cinereus TaxID=38626 RepID=A0A6P5LLQ4_PHACI|nr:LOW QUALITY PROTEIN: tuberoinfundibular peptide of 39 residues [Phascolarctos cinereus]
MWLGVMENPKSRERRRCGLLLLLLLLLLLPGIPGATGAVLPLSESPSSWLPWVQPPASLTLRDWSLQLTGEAGPAGAPGPPPSRAPSPGPSPSAGPQRRLVVADDAAFRERARLLAALERRRWLNSYMHKLLVVSDAAAD